MTGPLGEAGRAVLGDSAGLVPFSTSEGLEMFDIAVNSDRAVLVPARLNLATARRQAANGNLPVVLRGLIRVPATGTRQEARRTRQEAGPHDWAAMLSAQRGKALVDLVRRSCAAVLGHSSSDAVAAEQPFRELGLDSLASVELGSRLTGATGLRLPPTVAFEHVTPTALAAYLDAELRTSAQALPSSAALTRLFLAACADNKLGEGLDLLRAAARLRPTFDMEDAGDTQAASELITLADGGEPHLICIPSLPPPASPYQYRPLADAFRGTRTVSALSLPGFQEGEKLPATRDALIHALSEKIRAHVRRKQFTLIGYSSGGWLAHELTARLETLAANPACRCPA